MPNQISADILGSPEPSPRHPTATRFLGSIAGVLLRRKGIVIAVMTLAIALAVMYILTATKRYTSTTRLSVKSVDARITGQAPSDADSAGFLSNQQDVIISGSVLAMVMQDPAVAGLAALHESATPIASLRKIVSVEVTKPDRISISAETKDPAEAPIVASAVKDAYILYQSKPKESSIDNILAALGKHRDDANDALTSTVLDMQELESKYGISPGIDQTNPVYARLDDLARDLDAAKADLLNAQSDNDAARKALPPPPGAAPDDPTQALLAATMDETQLHARLEQLQQQLADGRQQWGPNFPRLQALEKQVDQTSRLYVAAIGRRLKLAQARRDQLQQEYDAQADSANKLNAATQHYKRLALQAQDQQKAVAQFDGRISDMERARDAGSVDITVAAPASEAAQSAPHKATALGLALIVGLLAGCGMALFRDRLDDRLHSAQDVRAGLGVKLLGVVPTMPTGISPAVAAQKVALDPTSEIAEAYRAIRTALYFGAPKDRSKTILITSPSPGDGKTTTAANLAIAMAQAGKRVVLVDGDLRHPQQHAIFGARDRIGVASLLAGQFNLDQALQATNIDNLDLLACGKLSKNPHELLNSSAFVELLETLAERYDQVVVDSPAVLGQPDARIIAASCDLTVMVLRAQKSTRKRSTLARDGLLGVGARLLGIIVNDVAKTSDQSDAGGYGYPTVSPAALPPRLSAEPDTTRALSHPSLRRPG